MTTYILTTKISFNVIIYPTNECYILFEEKIWLYMFYSDKSYEEKIYVYLLSSYIYLKWLNNRSNFNSSSPLFRNKRFMLNERLQNLAYYFWIRKPMCFFFRFSIWKYILLNFFPHEFPGLCRHIPGNSWGKKSTFKLKNEKKLHGFRIQK